MWLASQKLQRKHHTSRCDACILDNQRLEEEIKKSNAEQVVKRKASGPDQNISSARTAATHETNNGDTIDGKAEQNSKTMLQLFEYKCPQCRICTGQKTYEYQCLNNRSRFNLFDLLGSSSFIYSNIGIPHLGHKMQGASLKRLKWC